MWRSLEGCERADDKDDLDVADLCGEMIELRLHGIQTLPVEIDRVQELVKNVFDSIEPLLHRGGLAV